MSLVKPAFIADNQLRLSDFRQHIVLELDVKVHLS